MTAWEVTFKGGERIRVTAPSRAAAAAKARRKATGKVTITGTRPV